MCLWIGSTSLFSTFAQADRSGCEDHPLITRYPGSVIDWCNFEEYQVYQIATGPMTGYRRIDERQEVAGKVSRLYYRVNGDRTVTEVYRNYLQAAQEGGFRVLAQGLHPTANVAKTVGGRTWLGTAYAANPLPASEGINLFHGTSTSGGTGYFAAKLDRAEGAVYLTVMAYQHRQDEVLVQVDIIESADMEGGLVSVDAAYMRDAISREGKVALYGLHFEHDKATLTPDSEPELQQIAQMLRETPTLKVYVVGHTDLSGSLSYNLDLSLRRATAVVEALVQTHGIARSRLEAKGVGPLVPARSNRQDAGRARNRRVELVER